MNIRQYMADHVSELDVDFGIIGGDINKQISWFDTLKDLSAIDVSLAHIIQHDMGARINVTISESNIAKEFLFSKPYGQLTGTYSVPKSFDSCTIQNGILSGQKMMCSNINADYHTFFIRDKGVVFIKKDAPGLKIDISFQPIGMEATETGNLILNNITPDNYILLDTFRNKVLHGKRLYVINLAFCTVNLGLCIQLVEDLKAIFKQRNISNSREIQYLEHRITIYNGLWKSMVQEMVNITEYDTEFIKKIMSLYSEGKDILANIIHNFLLFGDGRNTVMGASSQRFRDALVYVTHRTGFYQSLNYETSTGHKFLIL